MSGKKQKEKRGNKKGFSEKDIKIISEGFSIDMISWWDGLSDKGKNEAWSNSQFYAKNLIKK
jgi:hypothetical protein